MGVSPCVHPCVQQHQCGCSCTLVYIYVCAPVYVLLPHAWVGMVEGCGFDIHYQFVLPLSLCVATSAL